MERIETMDFWGLFGSVLSGLCLVLLFYMASEIDYLKARVENLEDDRARQDLDRYH